jgi:TPR repeat protein
MQTISLSARLLFGVAVALSVSPAVSADKLPPDPATPRQTRPVWVPPAVWYDVDPAVWDAADVARIERDARAGDAQAQYALGVLKEDGKRMARDLPDALRFYRLAAEQGHASAQASVARMLLNGWASPKNLVVASEWNEKAAAQGNRRAVYNQGYFVRRDRTAAGGDAAALPFSARAGELGLPQGAVDMARHHRKNAAEATDAWRWLGMAVDTGFAPALLEFDEWCNQTPDGPGCFEHVGNALARAAAAGYPPAQRQFGVRLWNPHDRQVAWAEALRTHFIKKAPDTPGLSPDKPEGARWLTRAAQAGDAQALFNVGLLLEEKNAEARYFKPSYKAASIGTIRSCYQQAAETGLPDAMVALVMTMQQEQENDPLAEPEREALAAYWTGKAGETGVFERNQRWAMHFPEWRDRIGTPAPAFLRKSIAEPARCALEPLPGASKAGR